MLPHAIATPDVLHRIMPIDHGPFRQHAVLVIRMPKFAPGT